VVIKNKDELRARIGRSPDRSDACAMVFGSREPARWWLGAFEKRAGQWDVDGSRTPGGLMTTYSAE
jgi:hypothetical protein